MVALLLLTSSGFVHDWHGVSGRLTLTLHMEARELVWKRFWVVRIYHFICRPNGQENKCGHNWQQRISLVGSRLVGFRPLASTPGRLPFTYSGLLPIWVDGTLSL